MKQTTLRSIYTRFAVTTLLIVGALAFFPMYAASAHVTVKPSEVLTASYQVFTVSVPNEKPIPTVKVRLEIPSPITNITPTMKPGWQITTQKDGSTVTAIIWEGNEITDGRRDEFTFSAKTPDSPTELAWKAYQTYTDGTTVAWDQPATSDSHGSNIGPFSVTSVIQESTDSKSDDSDSTIASDRALYASIVAIVSSLIAIFLATRPRSQ